jgi:predicted transcriptional regulator
MAKKKTEFLTVRIDPDQRRALRAIAKGEGKDLGPIVRVALGEYIERRRQAIAEILRGLALPDEPQVSREVHGGIANFHGHIQEDA